MSIIMNNIRLPYEIKEALDKYRLPSERKWKIHYNRVMNEIFLCRNHRTRFEDMNIYNIRNQTLLMLKYYHRHVKATRMEKYFWVLNELNLKTYLKWMREKWFFWWLADGSDDE